MISSVLIISVLITSVLSTSGFITFRFDHFLFSGVHFLQHFLVPEGCSPPVCAADVTLLQFLAVLTGPGRRRFQRFYSRDHWQFGLAFIVFLLIFKRKLSIFHENFNKFIDFVQHWTKILIIKKYPSIRGIQYQSSDMNPV